MTKGITRPSGFGPVRMLLFHRSNFIFPPAFCIRFPTTPQKLDRGLDRNGFPLSGLTRLPMVSSLPAFKNTYLPPRQRPFKACEKGRISAFALGGVMGDLVAMVVDSV